MNPNLKHFLERYAELERTVQELISRQCGALCTDCTQVCCRTDICEEAIESPFLRLLNGHTGLDSDAYGFLCENGCALSVGRPPVCLEYFCDEQLYRQPDPIHEKVLRTLGALVSHAGRNAHAGAHLVEIWQEEQLDHLAFQLLEKQLNESFQTVEMIRDFYHSGELPDGADALLDRITFSE